MTSVLSGCATGKRFSTLIIDQQIRKGYLVEVPFSEDLFISPGFVKVKPGRLQPGTSIPVVRLLGALQYLNAILLPAPAHHRPPMCKGAEILLMGRSGCRHGVLATACKASPKGCYQLAAHDDASGRTGACAA